MYYISCAAGTHLGAEACPLERPQFKARGILGSPCPETLSNGGSHLLPLMQCCQSAQALAKLNHPETTYSLDLLRGEEEQHTGFPEMTLHPPP